MAILTRKPRFRFRKPYIFSISAGILAMMTKSCPLMVYFRKRLTPEVLGEINEMIVRDAKERQVKEAESKDDDDDSDGQPGTGGNSGTMIVDATCAPSNIRYPQDVSLLNEARENAETLLDVLHDPAGGKASNLPQTRPERLPEIHKMP